MNLLINPKPHRARGSTLIVAIFVVALLTTLIGLAVDYSGATSIAAHRGRDYTAAQALANGTLEAAFKRWQLYMLGNQGTNLPTAPETGTYTSQGVFNYTSYGNLQASISGLAAQINAASLSTGYYVKSLTISPADRSDSVIMSGGQPASHYSNTSGGVTVSSGTHGPLANVPGWIATTYSYQTTVVVAKIGATATDGSAVVSVSRYFQQADAPLFQAMLFFQDDLELHPGAAMTLYGLVHTNSNLYAATSASLTFSSNVSFHGNTSTLNPAPTYKYEDARGYVEGVTATLFKQEAGNWNNPTAPVYSSSRIDQLSNVQALYPLGTDASTAVDPNNPNASGTHEIIDRPAPVSATNPNMNPAYTDPSAFAAHRVYNSATLRVFINHNSSYTTTTPGGATISSQVHVYTRDSTNQDNSVEVVPGKGTQASPYNIANYIAAAITPDSGTGNIYDYREGRAINADTIDMSVLTPYLNSYAASNTAYNQVMYVTDITNADSNGGSGNSDAIRVRKGGTLPDAGLTLASGGPVYVQGDYNTGTTYNSDLPTGAVSIKTQPVSNTGADPTQYTVANYTQKPAAIIGDAVMILSNNWLDSNSSSSVTSRVPTPTTFNAAIVSGSVLTTSTAESGGAHNFPRFLENWNGMNFTYHGSMVELYASKLFTGTYGKSNVYSAPSRRWYFDNNLLSSPPPGNLRTTTYARGRWVHNVNS